MIIDFLRQFRIGPFAIFDFSISYLGLWLLSPLIIRGLKRARIGITLASIMWLVVPLSVLVHLLIGRYTPLTLMFLDSSGGVLAKLVMVVMLGMGLRGIRRLDK